MPVRNLFAVALLCSLIPTLQAAEVVYWGEECPGFNNLACGPGGAYSQFTINIIGEIESGDLEKLEMAIAESTSRQSSISISSSGGDVIEAMKIGRFLRDSMMSVKVNENAECVSACFLVVVGATSRYIRAPIGIHRAYFSSEYYSSLSPIEAEREYRRLDKFVRAYLDEMYVPEDVVAEMMATKSTTESYLHPDDFRMRIGRQSPAIEEWLIAKCGEISEQERFDIIAIGAQLGRDENITSVNDLAPTGNIEDETPEDQKDLQELFEMYKLDPTDLARASYADTLSEEYKTELARKRVTYAKCTNFAEWQHQDEIIAALKKKYGLN